MSLAQFSIIVAVDSAGGIAKNHEIPWNSSEDMKFFRDTTKGKGKNAVIMGRITYESIPEEHRPLEGRMCVIISRTWKQENHPDIKVYSSLIDALVGLGSSKIYEDVFIAGGEHIYREAIERYMYLCKKIYVTRFKMDYNCDQFFPLDNVKDYPLFSDPTKSRDYSRYTYVPKITHEEYQYLNLLKQAKMGELKNDRTGVGTSSIFGTRMEFNIENTIPILTTKKVNWEAVVKELLFFISGKSDTRILSDQGVKIWEGNTRKEALEKLGLPWDEGDCGPMYGHQFRHWNAKYEGCDKDYKGQGIDQLKKVIDSIRTEPHSRRHIISTWNPEQLDQMCLSPCHVIVQFNVSSDKKFLDCQVYQRSGDMFLGIPFNIASYSILTHMIANITSLRPRRYIHVIGDTHVYSTHTNQVNTQLNRMPRPFPTLKFRNATRIHEIEDYELNSFIVEGYSSWPYISAEMAV
jgi:dihydrofolate reductase/thymidylate synthase